MLGWVVGSIVALSLLSAADEVHAGDLTKRNPNELTPSELEIRRRQIERERQRREKLAQDHLKNGRW